MKNKIRIVLIFITKHSGPFRRLIRIMLEFRRRIRFNLRGAGIDTEDKTALFTSFNGKAYSDTPKAVYEYMLSNDRYADYTFIWSFKEPDEYMWLEKNRNTKVIQYNGEVYEKALARAKYWITNYRVFDHIWPKRDQVYVQCWHGTPLKRLGFDLRNSDNAMNSKKEIEDKYRTDAAKFKYLLSPSAFTSEKFSTAWNLAEAGKEDTILEIGYPRNDRLINTGESEKDELKKKLGLPDDKKVILYAPTWRDNQHNAQIGYTYDLNIDFKKLRKELGEEYVIIFRVHYLVSSSFDFEEFNGFIYDFSNYDDINDLYIVSDLLITDYSSVLFDYANLKKPMLFYMYDLEEYADSIRGFYISIDELPGSIITAESQLAESIKREIEDFQYDDKYEKFNRKYDQLDDGHAAERFAEKVFSI